MDAADLLTGDRLLNDDGSWAEVVSSEVLAEPLRAYNLTVEGWHTYFVAANVDAAPVWVHNNCFGVPSTKGLVGTELEEHLIRHMPEGFSVGRVSR